MKKGKTVLLVTGALALILVAGICSMGLLFQSTTDNAENLYSQIDNEKIAPITPHGGMNYRYTLQAYTESGAGKNLDLDTSRELRDGAYVLVRVAPRQRADPLQKIKQDPPSLAVQAEPPLRIFVRRGGSGLVISVYSSLYYSSIKPFISSPGKNAGIAALPGPH